MVALIANAALIGGNIFAKEKAGTAEKSASCYRHVAMLCYSNNVRAAGVSYITCKECLHGRCKTLLARSMGPTWVPSWADRTQVGPMNFAIWVVVKHLDKQTRSSIFDIAWSYLIGKNVNGIRSKTRTFPFQKNAFKCTICNGYHHLLRHVTPSIADSIPVSY